MSYEDSNNLNTRIKHVCLECGIAANVLTCLKRFGKPPKQLAFQTSTYHQGICDYCREEKMITETRDFFYPDFGLLTIARKQWENGGEDKGGKRPRK